jgi:hypothetical protein
LKLKKLSHDENSHYKYFKKFLKNKRKMLRTKQAGRVKTGEIEVCLNTVKHHHPDECIKPFQYAKFLLEKKLKFPSVLLAEIDGAGADRVGLLVIGTGKHEWIWLTNKTGGACYHFYNNNK